MAKGRGTIIQDIPPKDELAAVAVGTGAFVVTGTGRGSKPAEWKAAGKDLTTFRGARARKGQPIPAKLKPTGLSTAASEK
jgi:topoisomerase-4 subunit A